MMKKLTAMLLALCMLLAAVPALGDSAAGNWYMTLADVTLGYILLNEDGTAVVNVSAEQDTTGTWAEDGNTVTITVDGEAAEFVCDGTTLKNDLFPLAFTREQGKVPLDLISKMMSGEEYELPEGLTEGDVMTAAVGFMSEYTKLMSAAGEGEQPTAAPEPAGDAGLTVVQENFKIIESYSGYRGVFIAKIRNDGAVPLFVTDGALSLLDAEGNLAGQASYLSSSGSKYLEPGEVSFVSMEADLESDAQVTYKYKIETDEKSWRSPDKVVKAENAGIKKAENEYSSDSMKVTVINDSDEPLGELRVVFVLLDAEGNLLDINYDTLYNAELGANSSITMYSSVDSRVRKYLEANGIEPAAVEAYAWVEGN